MFALVKASCHDDQYICSIALNIFSWMRGLQCILQGFVLIVCFLRCFLFFHVIPVIPVIRVIWCHRLSSMCSMEGVGGMGKGGASCAFFPKWYSCNEFLSK